LPHGLAKRGERSFGLSRQHIRRVAWFAASLHEALGGRACCKGSLAHFRREYRTAVKMRADAGGQVPTTPRAEVRMAADKI